MLTGYRWLTLFVMGWSASTAWAAIPNPDQVKAALADLQVPFIANTGQLDDAVAFYAPIFTGRLFVTRDGKLVYSLPGNTGRSAKTRGAAQPRSGWTLVETPVGASTVTPHPGNPARIGVSSLIGNDPERWRSRLATFDSLGRGEVWPGIYLNLKAHGSNVEKLFTVTPRADVGNIRLRLAGASQLGVSAAGALLVATELGTVELSAPVAWQEHAGERIPVRVAYTLYDDGYGFTLGVHDPDLAVTIDPLLQSTYPGGNGGDSASAIAVTASAVYIAGSTDSTNFPGTTGGPQPANGGLADAFVARLNTDLTALDQATYLCGHRTGGDGRYRLRGGDHRFSRFPRYGRRCPGHHRRAYRYVRRKAQPRPHHAEPSDLPRG